MSERISVRDVATAAGVSIGSVSRVLNNSGYASPQLRQRVLQTVARLGYEPDFTARHLRANHTKTIGYLLPNLANPSLVAQLSEVERLLQATGYALLVGSSERPARDRELIAFFESRRLEGLIASPMHEYPGGSDCPFSHCRLPVVLVERQLGHPLDSVVTDHHGGLRQAMSHLLTLGHRRVALFAGGAAPLPAREQLAGYRAALAAAGLPFDEALVSMPDTWQESSRLRMAEMLCLAAPPTAIIAQGAQMLAGAVHVARDKGMEIPRDLSVMGIGTMQSMDLMYPPITALRYPFERSAQATVQLMMERIAGAAPAEPRTVVVPWDLIVGASCTLLSTPTR